MRYSAGTPRACARWGERYRPQQGQDAAVELRLGGGSCCRQDLLNISTGGVSFGLERVEPCLASGTRINDVVVHIGRAQIAGSLVIVHVTEGFSVGTVCGAAFTPATEMDRIELSAVLDGLAGMGPRDR